MKITSEPGAPSLAELCVADGFNFASRNLAYKIIINLKKINKNTVLSINNIFNPSYHAWLTVDFIFHFLPIYRKPHILTRSKFMPIYLKIQYSYKHFFPHLSKRIILKSLFSIFDHFCVSRASCSCRFT